MVAPKRLEAGDVVHFIEVDHYQQHNIRRCKILSIGEPDSKNGRESRVLYLDTNEQAPKIWKGTRGFRVHGGPKMIAARAGQGDLLFIQHNGGHTWRGYLAETK